MKAFSLSALRGVQAGVAALIVLLAVLVAQPVHAQHTSSECPPQTASVTSGGTVSIDITDCAFDIGFAGFGAVDGGAFGPPDFPSHGAGNMRRQDDSWILDYSHNGATGIGQTDVFEIADASFNGDGDVLITITILPATSPITVTPNTLPTLTAGASFSQALAGAGGTGPYAFALQSGVLPAGLTLSPTGVLSGTPTVRGGYTFSVRATDQGGLFTDKGYTGTIQPPTLVMSPNLIVIPRNQSVTRTLSTSGGVTPYSYMVETFPNTMPAGLGLSSGGVISGSTSAAAGDYPLTIRVTDGSTGPGQWFELEPLTIRLTDNAAPTANAGANQTVASAASVTLDGTASSDPENTALTFAWTQTGGPAVTLSSTSVAQPTFTAPTVAWNAPSAQTLTFSLTVSDGVNTSTADSVTITVNPAPNQSPTANAGPDQSVASSAVVTLTGVASTDPEGQPLSYTWSQVAGPGVILTGDTTATPGFTAPTVAWNAAPVILTFSLTVSDGVNASSADTVRVTVNPAANQLPLANAGADQTVGSAAGVTLDGTGSTDPEAQPLGYAWVQTGGPAVLLSDATVASPGFTAPTVSWNAAPEVLTFALTVNDGVNTSTADTVQITVSPAANQLPLANAGADQTVASGAAVTLDGSGSTDPEAQPLGYAWVQTGGPAVLLSDATAASPGFTAPTVSWNAAPEVLTFALTVNDGVNSSTADTVQITVTPAANQVPLANAGADQTVASGAAVTLDGSGSTDPEAQPLGYAWAQTSGPAVTLTGAASVAPGFTAPTLAWNAPDQQLVFELVVNDGVQDGPADTVTITVTAPVDLSAPTVTLAGMPASVLPGDTVAISVSFSEPVTGLSAADFAVTNGLATALSGSGASYTVTLTASGGGTLSVMLPADSAFDAATNGNLASNTLTASAGTVEETETAIAEYLSRRANALVGAQPDLIRLLNPGGPMQVSVSSKGFGLATNGTQSVWASLHGQWGESGDTDTRYVLGAVGSHVWLGDRSILGLMLEFDHMRQDEPTRRIEGTGWLVGPYIAGQFRDQPLYYEGRLLWGRSDNEIAQTGQPTASFGSERFLAQVKLQGEFALGRAIAAPFVDASYVSDRQDAYTDGLGNPISAQKVKQSQIALGIDLRQAFPVNGGLVTPSAGISAVYSSTSGGGTVTLSDPEHDGWRGRLRAGLTYERGTSRFEASAFYDGIGTSDYHDYGLSLGFETRF